MTDSLSLGLIIMKNSRKEKDAFGEMEVPADAYWGISTQRAVRNFKISGRQMPKQFILALATVKKACLLANLDLGTIESELANAISKSVDEILLEKKMLDQFPVDIFQTGSGTQSNMNMNEVLANRANEVLGHPRGTKSPVHPNDHVNLSQSSNDVIPTAMHIAALAASTSDMVPSLKKLIQSLANKIAEFADVIKVGRTHLEDAVPIPLSMELEVYRLQMANNLRDLEAVHEELVIVPIGGTAVGTGLNAPEGFAEKAVEHLSRLTQLPIRTHAVKAEGIASHRALGRLSASLRQIALSCLKMANDIRLMASGPRAGLGELLLPQNEPGSSIMPGKVNLTQCEALAQVCVQVIGHDATVTFAESQGSLLDLNVTKPLMTVNVLDAIHILSNGIRSFVENCLDGIKVNEETIKRQLESSLMIVTRLSPFIGYDKAGEIASRAHTIINQDFPIRYGAPEVFTDSNSTASVSYIIPGHQCMQHSAEIEYNPRILILQLVRGQ
ncbi:MAG: class II fumarate hydratase [Candidatus Thorarchaeota archaeon]|nr:MAG: class II fumarate hydratase [Candidatus Thorarchaeota archaeon]